MPDVLADLVRLLPGLTTFVPIPCGESCGFGFQSVPIYTVVMHLNDHHKWSREKIADWLDTLDVDLTFPTELPPRSEAKPERIWEGSMSVWSDSSANWTASWTAGSWSSFFSAPAGTIHFSYTIDDAVYAKLVNNVFSLHQEEPVYDDEFIQGCAKASSECSRMPGALTPLFVQLDAPTHDVLAEPKLDRRESKFDCMTAAGDQPWLKFTVNHDKRKKAA